MRPNEAKRRMHIHRPEILFCYTSNGRSCDENCGNVTLGTRFSEHNNPNFTDNQAQIFFIPHIVISGDSLSQHTNQAFSTVDRDNDNSRSGNCAELYGGGGWWYDRCYLNQFTYLILLSKHYLVNADPFAKSKTKSIKLAIYFHTAN